MLHMGFFGLGIIALHTNAGVPLCFSDCKFGVFGRKFRSKEEALLFAFWLFEMKLFQRSFLLYFSIPLLTPEIYDKQDRVMSSSGSGGSPILETEVVSDQALHTLCNATSAPLLRQPRPRDRVE